MFYFYGTNELWDNITTELFDWVDDNSKSSISPERNKIESKHNLELLRNDVLSILNEKGLELTQNEVEMFDKCLAGKFKVNPFVKTIFQIFKVGNLYSLKSSPYIMQLLGYNIQIQVSGN
ncbi:hypothetical protein IJT93_09735 [bacterium]|nr:hypothetical protein [bacterium]